MGTSRKWMIIMLLTVAAALCVTAVIMAGLNTTALELFPEEIWGEKHELHHVVSSYMGEKYTMEAAAEELQAVFAEARLWRVSSPGWGSPGEPCFYLSISSETGEHWIYVGEDGYVLHGHRESASSGDPTFAWFRDDGDLYQSLMEKFMSLSDFMPELPWETVDWILTDGQEREILDQGEFDPVAMYDFMETAVSVPSSYEMTVGFDYYYYTLFVGNPDLQPLQRYVIDIDMLGTVRVRIQEADGVVSEQYYETDNAIFSSLDEMLRGSAGE